VRKNGSGPRLNGKSLLPSRADIVRLSLHVSNVPTQTSRAKVPSGIWLELGVARSPVT
jgi:hypothetical protein